jgi:hypothetical protein
VIDIAPAVYSLDRILRRNKRSELGIKLAFSVDLYLDGGIFFIDAFDFAWLCADSDGSKVFRKEHPLAWEFEEKGIVLVFDDCFEHLIHPFIFIYTFL